VRVGEPFQLVARPRFRGIGICREKWLAEWQYASVHEGRNTAKYQIAAKIKVIENRSGYILLRGILDCSGRSEICGRRIGGPQDHVSGSQHSSKYKRREEADGRDPRLEPAPIEQGQAIGRGSQESELLAQWMSNYEGQHQGKYCQPPHILESKVKKRKNHQDAHESNFDAKKQRHCHEGKQDYTIPSVLAAVSAVFWSLLSEPPDHVKVGVACVTVWVSLRSGSANAIVPDA
jgi:hypothetical protein